MERLYEKKVLDEEKNVYRLARECQGIRAKDLAEKLGISQSYIHAIESGERPLSGELRNRYLKELNLDEEIVALFNRRSKRYDSYSKLFYCLLKLICK